MKLKTMFKYLFLLVLMLTFASSGCLAFGISPVRTDVDFLSDSGTYSGFIKIVNVNSEQLTLSLSSSGVLENNIVFEDDIITIQNYEKEKLIPFKIIVDDSVAIVARGKIIISEVNELSGVGSAVSLSHEVVVRKYSDEYIDFSFGISQSSDKITFLANLENDGIKSVSDVSMEFNIGEEKTIVNGIDISSGDSQGISSWISRDLIPDGEYSVSAKIVYGDSEFVKTKKVWIGSPSITMLQTPENLYSGLINKFDVVLENNWNSKLTNIYLDFELFYNGTRVSSLRTKSFDLDKDINTTISDFFDASDLSPGLYSVKTIISVDGNRIKGQDFSLKLSRNGIFSSNKNSNTLFFVLTMILILLVSVIGWIAIKKHKNVYDN